MTEENENIKKAEVVYCDYVFQCPKCAEVNFGHFVDGIEQIGPDQITRCNFCTELVKLND